MPERFQGSSVINSSFFLRLSSPAPLSQTTAFCRLVNVSSRSLDIQDLSLECRCRLIWHTRSCRRNRVTTRTCITPINNKFGNGHLEVLPGTLRTPQSQMLSLGTHQLTRLYLISAVEVKARQHFALSFRASLQIQIVNAARIQIFRAENWNTETTVEIPRINYPIQFGVSFDCP